MLFTTKTLLHQKHGYPDHCRHFFADHPPVADDEPIPLTDVLERSGLDDALWCLRATTEPCEQFARLLAADFAEHVLRLFEAKYLDDPAPRRAIEVARRFARGQATDEWLKDARRAVAAAAADAADAAARADAADAAFAAARAAYAAAEAAKAAGCATADPAYAAAYAAAGRAAAAKADAADAERRWQTEKFKEALLAHN